MNVIIDTGIIISLADKKELFHNWCKRKAARLPFPFYTCESVLSEAFHLLEPIPGGIQTLLGFLEKDLIRINFHYSDNSDQILQLIRKYKDLPASFADACLVQMAESIPQSKIFTLDKDFTIYRFSNGKRIPLVFPEIE